MFFMYLAQPLPRAGQRHKYNLNKMMQRNTNENAADLRRTYKIERLDNNDARLLLLRNQLIDWSSMPTKYRWWWPQMKLHSKCLQIGQYNMQNEWQRTAGEIQSNSGVFPLAYFIHLFILVNVVLSVLRVYIYMRRTVWNPGNTAVRKGAKHCRFALSRHQI